MKIINRSILFLMLVPLTMAQAQDGQKVMDSILVRQQDSIVDKNISFNGYPYIFYTPETQLAFGGGGIFLFYTKRNENLRPSKVGVGAHYTTNKQYKFSMSSSVYFNDNKLVIETPVSFGYTLDKFWGVGNNTIERGNESYFREDLNIEVQVQVPPLLFFADRTGFILSYQNTNIVDPQENSFLNNEQVLGFDGGDLFGVGINLIWDRRDNLFYPTKGHYQYIKFQVYPEPSDFVYSSFELDVRHYKKLFKGQVLATNLYLHSVSSNAPFYRLPALGGQNRMRGYFNGRYRDSNYFTMQMEYRQYFWKRLGFVAFGGFGDVGNELTDLSFKQLKYSFGGGLRYLFNEKENVNLRMDIGIGQDGNTGIYFGIEESF